MSKKKQKAIDDQEWLSRLRTFATTGTWPSSAGNRPALRQKRWHDLYLKIEKCPLHLRGQTSLFCVKQTCVCGYHKLDSSDTAHLPATLMSTLPVKLPLLWEETLPKEDHKWIASTLFKVGAKGKPALRDDLKLWYDPPEPAAIHHQVPTPERFFSHSILVWMPYRLFRVRVFCPNPSCGQQQLTGAGLHKRARQVLDWDKYYNLVTETLTCSKCRTNYLSWSETVLGQLDRRTRGKFRVILTRKYACDIRVIRPLRERGQGNSPTCLMKQLMENHREEWLERVNDYLEVCARFMNQPSLFPAVCQEPPQPMVVPTYRWLLSVYGRDILSRVDHIKASITCTFGSILKMDSTKKITRKLPSEAKGTALWLTSVSNEVGQVLISVLTAQEGPALDLMADGLVCRYGNAGVDPPRLLYVDCGCCMEGGGETKLKARFGGWPDLVVRLDIFHFMKRLAGGCTTDAHALYPVFMSSLSACIFEWDPQDVSLLRRAKREQLVREGVPSISDALVDKNITKAHLATYCKRQTRGVEVTLRMIDWLLQELMGHKGRDLLGVPLLDREKMEHIWHIQRRHVKCIQDVPGVPLYTENGTTTTKEGIILTKYRCARGSSSLESFHLHLNRFIPGTSANLLKFQIYLLDGLHRWNQNCAAEAFSSKQSAVLTYTGDLLHCVNINSVKVFNRKLLPNFQPPAKYTGELIGVPYLLRQTGKSFQDVNPDSEEAEQMLEEVTAEEEEEDILEDEGFEDTLHHMTLNSLDDYSLTDLSSESFTFSASPTLATFNSSAAPQPATFTTKVEDEQFIPVAADPLDKANSRLAAAPQHHQELHKYHLPENTIGQAKLKKREASPSPIPSVPPVVQPKFIAQKQLFPPTGQVSVCQPTPVYVLTCPATSSIFQPIDPRLIPVAPALSSGPQSTPVATKRPYKRKVTSNSCNKCGQYRTAETGHSQYKGHIYCPSTETLTKDQWLQEKRK